MNSITTQTTIVTIKVEKNYKKDVVTLKLLLRQNKGLKAVISFAIKEFYAAIENGRGLRQDKRTLLRKKFQSYNKQVQQATKIKEDYVATSTEDCHDTEFSLISASQ